MTRYQFVDCRWELGDADAGRSLYLAGHVPGVSFLDLDLDRDLAASPGGRGRHPLPDAGDFARELAERLDDDRLAIVDARDPERYHGAVGIDPVGGRIPGAANVPFTAPELADELLDADKIVIYCGSGVTACVDLLALAAAGRPDAKLYPGSWSEWYRLDLPIERD